jgi:hypothetical protein
MLEEVDRNPINVPFFNSHVVVSGWAVPTLMGAQTTVVGHLLTQDGGTWTLSVYKGEDDVFYWMRSSLYGCCPGWEFPCRRPTMNTVNRCGASILRHYRGASKETLDQVAQWIQDTGRDLVRNQ